MIRGSSVGGDSKETTMSLHGVPQALAPAPLQTESSSSPRKSELRDKIRVLISLVVNPFLHFTLSCMFVGLLTRLLLSIFALSLLVIDDPQV